MKYTIRDLSDVLQKKDLVELIMNRGEISMFSGTCKMAKTCFIFGYKLFLLIMQLLSLYEQKTG